MQVDILIVLRHSVLLMVDVGWVIAIHDWRPNFGDKRRHACNTQIRSTVDPDWETNFLTFAKISVGLKLHEDIESVSNRKDLAHQRPVKRRFLRIFCFI